MHSQKLDRKSAPDTRNITIVKCRESARCGELNHKILESLSKLGGSLGDGSEEGDGSAQGGDGADSRFYQAHGKLIRKARFPTSGLQSFMAQGPRCDSHAETRSLSFLFLICQTVLQGCLCHSQSEFPDHFYGCFHQEGSPFYYPHSHPLS